MSGLAEGSAQPHRLSARSFPQTSWERRAHGCHADTDWSVDRLNNDGTYARNNLAVMSVRANRAKGALSFDEVLARSRSDAPADGLDPAEWLRLAVLMLGPCFADRPRQAPCLPLVAAPPAGTLRLAMQQVQHVFTVNARTQAGKNQLIRHFKPTSAEPRAEWRLRAFAEAMHVGLKGLAHDGDVWLQDGVMAALAQWRETLGDRAWALAGEVSRRLAGSRCLPATQLESWHLQTRGYAS